MRAKQTLLPKKPHDLRVLKSSGSSGATQLVIMLYSVCVPTCVHLPVCVSPRTRPSFVSHEPNHDTRYVRLLHHCHPLPPSLPTVPASDRQMSQRRMCWLVPSDQLPLISCPSSSSPSSSLVTVHLYPHGPADTKGCDSCADHRLGF